jgi:hypothetical protein
MSLFVLRELAGFFNELRRFVALKTVSFWRKPPSKIRVKVSRFPDRLLG